MEIVLHVYFVVGLVNIKKQAVTVRHMYAATAASALNYRGPTSAISKSNARGEQAIYI